jgi:hypothetical protein
MTTKENLNSDDQQSHRYHGDKTNDDFSPLMHFYTLF